VSGANGIGQFGEMIMGSVGDARVRASRTVQVWTMGKVIRSDGLSLSHHKGMAGEDYETEMHSFSLPGSISFFSATFSVSFLFFNALSPAQYQCVYRC